jgi:hypothetical protein
MPIDNCWWASLILVGLEFLVWEDDSILEVLDPKIPVFYTGDNVIPMHPQA